MSQPKRDNIEAKLAAAEKLLARLDEQAEILQKLLVKLNDFATAAMAKIQQFAADEKRLGQSRRTILALVNILSEDLKRLPEPETDPADY